MSGQEPTQFPATCAFGGAPAKVTVAKDKLGGVRFGLQPWVSAVRFTPVQFAELLDGLAELRSEA